MEEHQRLTGPELYEQGLAYLAQAQEYHPADKEWRGYAQAAQACFQGATAMAIAMTAYGQGPGQPEGDRQEWARFSHSRRRADEAEQERRAEQARKEALRLRNGGVYPDYPEVTVHQPSLMDLPDIALADWPEVRVAELIRRVRNGLEQAGATQEALERCMTALTELSGYEAVLRTARTWVVVAS